jgi:hypothetical protein
MKEVLRVQFVQLATIVLLELLIIRTFHVHQDIIVVTRDFILLHNVRSAQLEVIVNLVAYTPSHVLRGVTILKRVVKVLNHVCLVRQDMLVQLMGCLA